ncbi:hypothetical protein E9K97_003376 [Escherichia coli]|nr:hypothetical protein [Escherichia coli]EEU3346310.1 hypothetical protein [Escherichia coli]EEY6973050.1 hypothetical protein [Escherichia coli]EEY8804172.1 hypothetical protein [Escherichia coli]EFA5272606.1 hypothetical protein [Escherichia coli]
MARAGGMIVGSIKLDDSEIAIGEVPLTFIVDADQWLLQGQASCSVQSSDVLIVLPRDNSTVAGFDGQSSAVNVLGLNRPFHDWMSIADFQDFADQWFAAALGRPIELTVFDSPRDIPHHRKLTVTFEDGQVLKIRFDQGMGYWRINFASQWHYFDFRDDVSFQLVKMAQACNEGNVANSEESWATDVLVEVSAS